MKSANTSLEGPLFFKVKSLPLNNGEPEISAIPLALNSVHRILEFKDKFSTEQKTFFKSLGPPRPPLSITATCSSIGKVHKRHFHMDMYKKASWLCGCEVKNRLYCFPCLFFHGDKTWSKEGVVDLKHLLERIQKHDMSRTHIRAEVEFKMLGAAVSTSKRHAGSKGALALHNKEVKRRRDVLAKIVNIITFSACSEKILTDACSSSEEPSDIFKELVGLFASCDSVLQHHLTTDKTLDVQSQPVLNDLLDCILEVCREHIKEELAMAKYLALIVDDVSDVCDCEERQLAIAFRFEVSGEAVERFWGFLNIEDQNADAISDLILVELSQVIESGILIAQSYEGYAFTNAVVDRIQERVTAVYKSAHLVYSWGHPLDTGIQRAVKENRKAAIFLAGLSGITDFFNQPPHIQKFIHEETGSKIALHNASDTLKIIQTNRNEIVEIMDKLLDIPICSSQIILQASSILFTLRDPNFLYFVMFFYKLLPLIDSLSVELMQPNHNDGYKTITSLFIDKVRQLKNSPNLEELNQECIDDHHELEPITFIKAEINQEYIENEELEPITFIAAKPNEEYMENDELETNTLDMEDPIQSYSGNNKSENMENTESETNFELQDPEEEFMENKELVGMEINTQLDLEKLNKDQIVRGSETNTCDMAYSIDDYMDNKEFVPMQLQTLLEMAEHNKIKIEDNEPDQSTLDIAEHNEEETDLKPDSLGLANSTEECMEVDETISGFCSVEPADVLLKDVEQICDVIENFVKNRFGFLGYLEIRHILHPTRLDFNQHLLSNQKSKMAATRVESFPFIDAERLHTELSVIYEGKYFNDYNTATKMLQFIEDTNLISTLSETSKLLKIQIVAPMFNEDTSCSGIMGKMRDFLRRSSRSSDRLQSRLMVTLEKDAMISDIQDFDEKVVNKFLALPHRCSVFTYNWNPATKTLTPM